MWSVTLFLASQIQISSWCNSRVFRCTRHGRERKLQHAKGQWECHAPKIKQTSSLNAHARTLSLVTNSFSWTIAGFPICTSGSTDACSSYWSLWRVCISLFFSRLKEAHKSWCLCVQEKEEESETERIGQENHRLGRTYCINTYSSFISRDMPTVWTRHAEQIRISISSCIVWWNACNDAMQFKPCTDVHQKSDLGHLLSEFSHIMFHFIRQNTGFRIYYVVVQSHVQWDLGTTYNMQFWHS